jgi:hypothetical protein
MPVYDIICDCGFNGETFSRVNDLRDGRCKCPQCKQYAPQDWEHKQVSIGAGRELHGTKAISQQHWCHPTEVDTFRKGVARHGGDPSCVKANGDVVYRTQADKYKTGRAFAGAERELRQKQHKNGVVSA